MKEDNRRKQLLRELEEDNDKLESIIKELEREVLKLRSSNKKKRIILEEIEKYNIEI